MAGKNTISFGSYPQNLVTDSTVISALGTYDSSWKSYGYVLGTIEEKKVPLFEDYMYYVDKVYKSKKYRGVYFTKYRTDTPVLESRPSGSRQPKYGYNINTVYWFEYTPIVWEVLDKKDGGVLLLTQKAIDSQEFYFYADSAKKVRKEYQGQSGEVYDNNYKFSKIREWLNTTFYKTAFSPSEQAKILTTTQDNSLVSTGLEVNRFTCDNTKDKVFLLSVAEVNKYLPILEERLKLGTDYAKSQNLWLSSKGYCGMWWLRSPYQLYESSVKNIFFNGKIESGGAFGTTTGVVVAIVVK